jgi:hypothetical protein
MNALNKIGGALLLAGLAVAVFLGFQTPTGRRFWDGIWQAGATVVGYVGDQIARLNGTPVAGNLSVAVGIAGIGLVILLILLPKPLPARVFPTLVILAVLAAVILYQPSIVSEIGG